jgi:hypothetical protein
VFRIAGDEHRPDRVGEARDLTVVRLAVERHGDVEAFGP